MNQHICPANNCGRIIKPEHHMCRRHWVLVPRMAREAINFGYFRFIKYNFIKNSEIEKVNADLAAQNADLKKRLAWLETMIEIQAQTTRFLIETNSELKSQNEFLMGILRQGAAPCKN